MNRKIAEIILEKQKFKEIVSKLADSNPPTGAILTINLEDKENDAVIIHIK